jgi:hypothetical protein
LRPFENVHSEDPKTHKPFEYTRTRNERGQFVAGLLQMNEGVSADEGHAEVSKFMGMPKIPKPKLPSIGLKPKQPQAAMKPLVPQRAKMPQTQKTMKPAPKVKETGISKMMPDQSAVNVLGNTKNRRIRPEQRGRLRARRVTN